MRVPPEGPLTAKIIALGESPGPQELRQGRPFVGPAGRTLDDLLGAVGLDRDEIYITNTVKCEVPSDDKAKEAFFFQKGGPSSAYMEGIIDLVGEIKAIKEAGGGNVIVPMGNYALWALTQLTGIMKYRGSMLESSLVPGLKVIPTIHPAYFYHTWQWHELVLSEWDWQRIAAEAHTPAINVPQPDFLIDPFDSEIEKAVERYTSCELLTVDSEWYSPDSLAYIGFCDDKDFATVIPATSMAAFRAYKAILGSDVPKVFQNAIFDDVALARIGIEVKNIKHDLMLAWNAAWGDIKRKRLSVICSVLTDHPYYKDDLEFVGKNDQNGQIYCGTDCVVEKESMDKMLSSELRETGTERAYELTMLNYDIFAKASKMGVRCDLEKLRAMKSQYIAKADAIEDEISKLVGRSINCRSTPQVATLVYDMLGYKVDKRIGRSTAQAVLMDMAASDTSEDKKAILTAIIRVRQNRNIVSRYVHEGVVDRDGRIRTNWNLAGTRNGRYSSTDPWWNGWAMQTVPLEAREFVIPDPGHIFVGCDGEQAEARVVAVLTHDYDLLDNMAQGVDVHAKLVEDMKIFNMSYEQVIAQCKELGDKDKCHPRYLCKKVRHSSNYKQGPGGLKENINKEYLETNVGITLGLAKLLNDRYIEVSPGLSAWWEEVFKQLASDGYLINHWGRRRNFLGKIHKEDHIHRDAVAFVPQSDIADLTTQGIFHTAARTPWGQCMAHMHDGTFFQVPEDRAEETAKIMQEEMHREIHIGSETLIVPYTIKTGMDWMNMK